jgi:hypothetical protein
VQFAKKAVYNMEKSTFLGFKDRKNKYKTQNLDSLDTHFCACGSGCKMGLDFSQFVWMMSRPNLTSADWLPIHIEKRFSN